MKQVFILLSCVLMAVGCGKGGPKTQVGENPPSERPSDFKPDHLKVHRYKIVAKYDSASNKDAMFHVLTVDRHSKADYFIARRVVVLGRSFKDTLLVKCLDVAKCEVREELVNGSFRTVATSVIRISEDTNTNKKEIEVRDPTYLKAWEEDTFSVLAKDENGKASAALPGDLQIKKP